LLAQAQFADDGSLRRVGFQWLKAGNRQHKEWETTALGMIEIDQDTLSVHVNSRERADLFRRIVEETLGARGAFRTAEIESADEFLEDEDDDEDSGDDWELSQEQLADLPEVQA